MAAAMICSLPMYAVSAEETDVQPGERKLADFTGKTISDGDYRGEILEDGTVIITDYNNYDEEAASGIPAEIGGYPVSGIGEYACSYDTFEELTIPESVLVIEDNAFCGCEVKTNFTLPDGVQIGEGAFKSTVLPSEIIIPAGVYMGEEAFSYCNGAETVKLGKQVYLDKKVFSKAKDLKQVFFSEGSTIGEAAFDYCETLEEIGAYETDPQEGGAGSETVIGRRAFSDCESLKNVEIPSFVSRIGKEAFYYSQIEESLVLPENIYIAKGAFSSCDYYGNLVIPAGAELDKDAFQSSDGIETVSVGDDAKIGRRCFEGIGELKEVTLGNRVWVSKGAFANCYNLESLTQGEDCKIHNTAFEYSGVQAVPESDPAETLEEALAEVEAAVENGEYYRLSYMKYEDEEYDEAAIVSAGYSMFIILKEDGTGYLVSDGSAERLTWDEHSIAIESTGEANGYTRADDKIRLEAGTQVMEFSPGMADEELLPDLTPVPVDPDTRAGFYDFSYMETADGEHYGKEILDAIGAQLFLVLNADQTGRYADVYAMYDFTWDDTSLIGANGTVTYQYDNGELIMEDNGEKLVFVYMGTPEEAPEFVPLEEDWDEEY